jgi:hypothetical protein
VCPRSVVPLSFTLAFALATLFAYSYTPTRRIYLAKQFDGAIYPELRYFFFSSVPGFSSSSSRMHDVGRVRVGRPRPDLRLTPSLLFSRRISYITFPRRHFRTRPTQHPDTSPLVIPRPSLCRALSPMRNIIILPARPSSLMRLPPSLFPDEVHLYVS